MFFVKGKPVKTLEPVIAVQLATSYLNPGWFPRNILKSTPGRAFSAQPHPAQSANFLLLHKEGFSLVVLEPCLDIEEGTWSRGLRDGASTYPASPVLPTRP
jgi:hypothetical protein